MKNLLLLCFAMCIMSNLSAQEMINFRFVERYTKAELEDDFDVPNPQFDVDYYVVTYSTIGSDGNPDTAMAAAGIPVISEGSSPWLIYHHGTVNNRFDVPSRSSSESESAMLFGSYGYCALLPDYIGMSSSRGYHPYLHVETQARASVDLLSAVKTELESQNYSFSDELYLTGYSQGGHASAATQKAIQENPVDGIKIMAASHMSGPYSMAEVMYRHILSDQPYLTIVYIPHTILGMQEVYGNLYQDLEDIFKPSIAPLVEDLYNGADLFAVNSSLLQQLVLLGGLPRFMFQDSVIINMEANVNHPIRKALQLNDLSSWVPESPTRLVYCTADDQVPYRNAVVADSIMNLLGAPDLESIDVDPSASHGGCVNPAFTFTIDFFNSIRTTESIIFSDDNSIYVTQESKHVTLKSEKPLNGYYEIYNASGQIVKKEELVNRFESTVHLKDSGIYFLRVVNGQLSQSIKIIND